MTNFITSFLAIASFVASTTTERKRPAIVDIDQPSSDENPRAFRRQRFAELVNFRAVEDPSTHTVTPSPPVTIVPDDSCKVVKKTEYTTCIDPIMVMPIWVSEILTSANLNPSLGSGRASRAYSPWDFTGTRESEDAFKQVKWDKGHLAAAANHISSQAVMDETFVVSANIVPQDPIMNGSDWQRLEDFARSFVMKGLGPVNIVSGPIWRYEAGEKPEYVGIMRVPTHLFKAIKIGANSAIFLMKNAPEVQLKPLSDFKVNYSELGVITGLNLSDLASDGNLCYLYPVECGTATSDHIEALRMLGRAQLATSRESLSRIYTDTRQASWHDSPMHKKMQTRIFKLIKQKMDKIERVEAELELLKLKIKLQLLKDKLRAAETVKGKSLESSLRFEKPPRRNGAHKSV